MPKYHITSPEGKTYEITAPSGASQQQVMEFAQAQFAPKGKPLTWNPTDDMSTGQRLLAGVGMGMHDVYMGAKQRVGLASQEEIDRKKLIDAPLKGTPAGAFGNVAGKIAAGVPAVFVPGANTIGGAAAIGALQGAIEPTATGESILQNTAIGGAGGGAGVVAGRALRVGLNGARSLMEPFYAAGQNRVAGRVLERFAANPNALSAAGGRTITGANPTLSEATLDPGIAALERSLAQQDPQISGRFGQRALENNAARVNALQKLSGADGYRDFAAANRAGTAQPMYEDAFSVAADAVQMTPEQSRTMMQLMRAPDIRDASSQARRNAANAGTNVGPSNTSGSIEGLHQVKLAMDDMIAKAKLSTSTSELSASAAEAHRLRGLESARTRLVEFIESLSPEYKNARQVYKMMSRPVNQADIGAELLKRGTSAEHNWGPGADMSGTPRLMSHEFLNALRDEGSLMQRATGRDLGKSLGGVLEPGQEAMIRAVARELDQGAALGRAANGPGSQTAKSLASQNLLRQALGPTGLPQSWAENALLQTFMRPVQYGMQAAEPKIQQRLADILLDPSQAQNALSSVQHRQLTPMLQRLLPYLQQAGQQSVPAALVSR